MYFFDAVDKTHSQKRIALDCDKLPKSFFIYVFHAHSRRRWHGQKPKSIVKYRDKIEIINLAQVSFIK